MKVILIAWLASMLLAVSAIPALAQTSDELYHQGKSAFDQGNYLLAVKYLFAYQNISRGTLEQSLMNKLDSAIDYCDEQIVLAIKTKKELDKHGHIIEVTVDASGSADGWQTKTKTKKYQPPRGKYLPKPKLPSSAPKQQAKQPAHAVIAKPLFMAQPKGKSTPGVKPSDKQSEQYAKLERRYKLLAEKYKKQAESYDVLKHKYMDVARKYRELKREMDR